MTPKQIERVQKKIKAIRKAIYDEKRLWSGYHDGRGLRYVPPQYYLKIQDYKGGMTYFRWFNKNFPDDGGAPEFLLEWTIVLFKNGKLKDAETKAIQTYFANEYLFDKFFERPIIPLEQHEDSDLYKIKFAEDMVYAHNQPELTEFAAWLANVEQSERFKKIALKYLWLIKTLKSKTDREERSYLSRQIYQLRDGRLL